MTSKEKLVGNQHQQQAKQLLLNTNGKSSSAGGKLQQAAIIDHQSTGTTHAPATTTTTTTTTSATSASLTGTKLWTYFERSASDNSRLRCTLCSIELCNYDDILQSSSTSLFLWNHLRVKHAIGEPINKDSNSEQQVQQRQQHHHYPKRRQSNHSNPNSSSATTIISGGGDRVDSNMTNHKHHRLKLSSGDGPKQHQGEPVAIAKSRKEKEKSSYQPAASDERRNRNATIELLDHYNTARIPSKASLKPLPSSSLSKNLFARLNQISEPVTRKLKFWNKKSFQVNQYDPCFKVIYLGNLGIQFWSKDENCLEKPLNTLWNNYLVNMKTEIIMRLTICNSGLKAITRQHGLTQYWSNRLVYCCSHKNYPKIFAWIYRHEGKKMRQELRCHAVFCSSPERASKMVSFLSQRLTCALQEFKREKKSRGGTLPPPPPRLGITGSQATKDSLSSASTALAQRSLPRTVPLRRQILAKGSANFRPPLERSKSAPKLTSIREEDYESEEEDEEEEEAYDEEEEDLYERQQEADDDVDDDISRDEFEYEQSFGDRDDDDDNSDDFNGHESSGGTGEGKQGDDGGSAHKLESNSLSTTANEEISNSSSVYATTGDISYDNIVVNKHHLLTNHERLDNESTQTAPELTITSVNSAASSLQRRGSQMRRRPANTRSHHPNQHLTNNESSGDFTDATSSDQDLNQPHSVGSYQHDLDSQIAAEKQQAGASNATITNSSHIISSSGDGTPAGPNLVHQDRESSANITRKSKDDEEETSSSNKLNYKATTTLIHKPRANETMQAKEEADHNNATGCDNNLAIGEHKKHTAADGKNNMAAADSTTASQEPPATAAAAVDEPTQQDIILSWSNNLLIK